MTTKELLALGTGNLVVYRNIVVTFDGLSMRFEPTSPTTSKKHPMRARILFAGGGDKRVLPSYLTPCPTGKRIGDFVT